MSFRVAPSEKIAAARSAIKTGADEITLDDSHSWETWLGVVAQKLAHGSGNIVQTKYALLRAIVDVENAVPHSLERSSGPASPFPQIIVDEIAKRASGRGIRTLGQACAKLGLYFPRAGL